MATHDTNLADRKGSLLQSHKNYQPRGIFFYFVVALLLLTLAGGLAFQQQPHVEHVVKLGTRQKRHRHAGIRNIHQRALGGQTAEGVPHRHLADAELGGEAAGR